MKDRKAYVHQPGR